MNKKYVLLKDDTITIEGKVLHRVLLFTGLCLKDSAKNDEFVSIEDIRVNPLDPFADSVQAYTRKGGYVEGYHNLSQEGNCWIGSGVAVYGNARVKDDALLETYISNKLDNISVFIKDNAIVEESVSIIGDFINIEGNAIITDKAAVHIVPLVKDDSKYKISVNICGNSVVGGNSVIGSAYISNGIRNTRLTVENAADEGSMLEERKENNVINIDGSVIISGHSSVVNSSITGRVCISDLLVKNSNIEVRDKGSLRGGSILGSNIKVPNCTLSSSDKDMVINRNLDIDSPDPFIIETYSWVDMGLPYIDYKNLNLKSLRKLVSEIK
jgi:hypothetical protein